MSFPNNFIPENVHLHSFPAEDSVTMPEDREALEAALTTAITLNNEAYLCSEAGNYKQAAEKYLQAIAIKIRAYGEKSVHVCISLSGLADTYLSMGDLDNALIQASRMMDIAQILNSTEQKRIAVEILVDVRKAMAARK